MSFLTVHNCNSILKLPHFFSFTLSKYYYIVPREACTEIISERRRTVFIKC